MQWIEFAIHVVPTLMKLCSWWQRRARRKKLVLTIYLIATSTKGEVVVVSPSVILCVIDETTLYRIERIHSTL